MQEPADVIAVVAHAEMLLDHFGHASRGAEIGAVAVGRRSLEAWRVT